MPRRKKSDLSKRSRAATKSRNHNIKVKKVITDEELENAREKNRKNMARYRASRTLEEKKKAREKARLDMRKRRASRKYKERLRRFSSNVLIPNDVCDLLQSIQPDNKVQPTQMATDDSMSDDVFEDDTLRAPAQSAQRSTPSPTGYRDYHPPAVTPSRTQDDDDVIIHKTILLGDSGVGKTSLLVQFETGKFQAGNFSATVGIGFTVMLLGDSGVGKTCMLVRFRDGTFLAGNYISTVGIDFRNKVVTVDGVKVKLQIWDTAGQERFRSVTHAYYRDAHALLLLYDVTNKISFDNIRAWLGEIREYAQDDVVIMLLGNKSDSGLERAVRREEGQRLAREYQVSFMETSAKTGLNVEAAFAHVARSLVAKANPVDPSRLAVRAQPTQEQRSSCPPCS